jgi:hypothetical protein
LTRIEFIEYFSKRLDNIPVLKSLCIAQACLESSFGTKHFYNNYFGIKCHDPQKFAGCRLANTKEFIDGNYRDYRLAFQTYNSVDESISDYTHLMNLSRYEPVRKSKDYIEATEKVRKCGYATSMTYVKSLRKIIEQYDLTKYDGDGKMNADTQLTKNFKFKEFFCCGQIPPEQYWQNIINVAIELQKVRDILKKPIIITSGYRTIAHNDAIGGAKNSMHLTGLACDSHMIGINLYEYLAYIVRFTKFTGIGIGNPYRIGGNLIHSDLRHGDDLNKITIWVY